MRNADFMSSAQRMAKLKGAQQKKYMNDVHVATEKRLHGAAPKAYSWDGSEVSEKKFNLLTKHKAIADKNKTRRMTSDGSMERRPRENKLFTEHLHEMRRKRATDYNLGWASGENFIHSKTSKGRLYSQISPPPENKVTHQWEEV